MTFHDPRLDATTPAAVEPPGGVNRLAVVAFVLGLLVNPVAVVFGHLALRQIAESGGRGKRFAITGLVLGYASLVALVLLVPALIVFG